MKEMFCDFETYSAMPIKYGAFRYAQDKSTEIICLAYGPSKDKVKLWHPGMAPPKQFIDHIKKGGIVRSWNVSFEYVIVNYVGARLHGWPKLKPEQLKCTMTDALALSLPASLDACAEALGTIEQKDKRGKQLITLLSKPKKPTKTDKRTRRTAKEDPELFQEFYDYCIQDVKTEISIFETLPREVKDQELDLFHLTLKMNERGLPIDKELVDSILAARRAYEQKLNEEIEELTDGDLKTTNSPIKNVRWLDANGLILTSCTKADIKEAIKRDDISDKVRRFLEIRSELSRTPIKKFDFIENALCTDKTVKGNLIFNKATTGRFAGSGFQIHNLPRDSSENPEELITLFKTGDLALMNVYNEAIKLVRTCVTAPKNKKLVVSDFSSIENRVAAWLSGDETTLQDFIDGVDQYKRAAQEIYHIDYEDVNKDQRQLGKISVLACVFGGGWKTFKKVCEIQWGIHITDDESKEIVDGYRRKYYLIVRFWKELYSAGMSAIAQPGKAFTCGHIKFRVMDDFLYMRLPSGRLIAYYKPELRTVITPWGAEKLAITHMGQNTYTRKWERLTVIPGRLTENAVQATARDFLTDSMLRSEKAGYPLIACVHDENIALVDSDFGSIGEYNKIMEAVPEWGIGCPIGAEGYEGKRYKK